MQLTDYFAVLKNTNFTKLWASQVASQLTNYILSFAILIKVFKETNSSVNVSLILMAFGVATIFFGSIGGVFADRFDRKWLLTIANFLQAASIATYFLVGSDFWGLVLITFLYSSINQFYIPVEGPTIPSLVKKHQVLIANSYFAFTNSLALIAGFALAGPISVSFGQAAPFTAGVILLCLAGLATLTLPSLKPPGDKKSNSLAIIWQEYTAGVVHFWHNKTLHYPLLSLVSIQLINGMLITIIPAFMKEAIGLNLDTGSLLVMGPLGVGILVGALSLGFEEKHISKARLVLIGFLGMGTVSIGLSFINHFDQRYLFYAILALILGFFNAHIFAPSHSLLQTNALSHMRGRIYGSLYVLLQMAATLPTIFIGLLADRLPVTYIMSLLGTLLIIFGLSIWFRSKAHLTNA